MKLLEEFLIVEFDNIDDYNKKLQELFDNDYKELWNIKNGINESILVLTDKYNFEYVANLIGYFKKYYDKNKIISLFIYFNNEEYEKLQTKFNEERQKKLKLMEN